MKLQFLKDSPELDEFFKTLKWEDSINIEGDLDDYHSFEAIYLQESTGKYYKVGMHRNSYSSNAKFDAYRLNFKKDAPYVVSFYEVKAVEVVRTEWEEVDA